MIGHTVAATAALLACATAAHASPLPVLGPYGAGRDQAWVLRADGPARDVVVFGHGWKTTPPVGTSWVRQFGPWLGHLRARGSDIVFPRYQTGGNEVPGPALVQAFRRGVAAGLAGLHPGRVPMVVVGYSYGASLAFSYAANAGRWGLPSAAAVMSIFPAAPVPGSPLPPLRGPVHALVQVGDRDEVAGTGGAQAFWRWLAPLPASRRRYQVVRSRAGFVATHAAPKLSNRAARRAFWRPLDGLIAQARRDAAGAAYRARP